MKNRLSLPFLISLLNFMFKLQEMRCYFNWILSLCGLPIHSFMPSFFLSISNHSFVHSFSLPFFFFIFYDFPFSSHFSLLLSFINSSILFYIIHSIFYLSFIYCFFQIRILPFLVDYVVFHSF